MKYMQFIKGANNSVVKRVNLLVGFNEVVRSDIENVFMRKVNNYFLSKYGRAMWLIRVGVEYIDDNEEKIFGDTPYNLITVLWKRGVWDEQQIKEFLFKCRATPRKVFLIIDPAGELDEVFRKLFPSPSSLGVIIETNNPYDLERFVDARFGVRGVKVDPDVGKQLALLDLSQVLRAVKLFDEVNKFILSEKEVIEYALLQGILEIRMAEILFDKGKMAVLKHPEFLDISAKRFRGVIQYQLLTMLKIKLLSGEVQDCALKVGLPVPVYKRYKK